VAANRWTVVNAMPTARDHLAVVAFLDRVWALSLVVVGGLSFALAFANPH